MSTAVSSDRRTLNVRLLTPVGPVFDGPAVMVVAPSIMGEIGLLPRHAPLIAHLKVGETRVTQLDDTKQVFATSEGYLSIEDDQVLIMVSHAEEVGSIDRARAEESIQRADSTLASAGDDEVLIQAAQARKQRAENRLKVLDRAASGRSTAAH